MGLSAQQLSQPLRLGHLRGDPRRLLRCLERPHGKIQRHHLNRNQKMGTGHDLRRLVLLLGELRLPGIKLLWLALAETADKEGWPAARFLAALAEQEMVERSRRRFERHLEEARLPPGTPGSKRAPISCALARPAAENPTWRRRLDSP